jgi:hypothetical protein
MMYQIINQSMKIVPDNEWWEPIGFEIRIEFESEAVPVYLLTSYFNIRTTNFS